MRIVYHILACFPLCGIALDILCAGDSHERAEVIQQQMADEKLDRLRRRLEKIHKEELEDGYDTADVA